MKVIEAPEVRRSTNAEALIKEARQHQRRRWVIVMTFVIASALGIGLAVSTSGGGTGNKPTAKPTASPPPLSPAGILRLANKGLSGNFEATYKLSGDLGVFPGPGMDRARRPPRTLGTKERLDARQRRMVLSAESGWGLRAAMDRAR